MGFAETYLLNSSWNLNWKHFYIMLQLSEKVANATFLIFYATESKVLIYLVAEKEVFRYPALSSAFKARGHHSMSKCLSRHNTEFCSLL